MKLQHKATIQSDIKTFHEKLLSVDETRLLASHQRCRETGIVSKLSTCKPGLAGQALNRFLSHHAGMITYTHRLFAQTYHLIADHNQVFLLTDADACVLEMYSRPKILELVHHEKNIKPGVSIKEEDVGTNAVALALGHREPIVLRGDDHFCQIFQDNVCIAAPIIGPGGGRLACICISASRDVELGEKLALATFMAKELQNFLNFLSTSPVGLHGRRQTDLVTTTDYEEVVLTSRQQEVLEHFADGLSYKDIATELGLRSVKTVEEHLDNIRDKLSASNRRECIRKALELGLL